MCNICGRRSKNVRKFVLFSFVREQWNHKLKRKKYYFLKEVTVEVAIVCPHFTPSQASRFILWFKENPCFNIDGGWIVEKEAERYQLFTGH